MYNVYFIMYTVNCILYAVYNILYITAQPILYIARRHLYQSKELLLYYGGMYQGPICRYSLTDTAAFLDTIYQGKSIKKNVFYLLSVLISIMNQFSYNTRLGEGKVIFIIVKSYCLT